MNWRTRNFVKLLSKDFFKNNFRNNFFEKFFVYRIFEKLPVLDELGSKLSSIYGKASDDGKFDDEYVDISSIFVFFFNRKLNFNFPVRKVK